jgi:hypothetical protein
VRHLNGPSKLDENRLDSLRADTNFAWRQLHKRRLTSATAVLSLGLAIGACTTVFRLADALFLRPLPVSHPERLYALFRPDGQEEWGHLRFRQWRAALSDSGVDLIAASTAEQTDLSCGADPQMDAMVLAGTLAGVAFGMASVQYIEALLYGVRPSDWGGLAFPSVAILVVGSIAACLPTIRAVRTDPATVLRAE